MKTILILFTFHYELIITTVVAHSIKLTSTFTFHYELIITEAAAIVCQGAFAFTFHYELIITKSKEIIFEEIIIYISLSTNYNPKPSPF